MLDHNHIHFHEIYHKEDHYQMMENDVQVLLIYVQLHNQVDISKRFLINQSLSFHD
jgi:hypothetical protein